MMLIEVRTALTATILCASSIAAADTKTVLARFIEKKTKLADLVVPASGVVLLQRFHGPGEPPPPIIEKLVCGTDLPKLVAKWDKRIADDAAECTAQPPRCTFGRHGEWDPAIHVAFRPDAGRGLVLVAISVDDEVLVGEDDVAKEHAVQARLITKLSAKGCPAK